MFKYLNKTGQGAGLIICSLLLIPTTFVNAEIVNPYVIDEKPQVLFGDSVLITSTNTLYQGLENYVHEYVGGYLHLTFTYTHSRFSFSDYPPRLYITTEDPRATSTPGERDRSAIYQLLPFPVPPGHETDWYLYDIQFDSTGYAVSVVQGGATTTANFHTDVAGLTDTDWVALANLYPNTGSAFSMAFTPLLIKEPVIAPTPPVATTTPVIIVPGIMGTELLEDNVVNNLLWPNIINLVVSQTDIFLDSLQMNSEGNSINSIITGDLIKSLNSTDYFTGLINQAISDSYQEGISLFTNPYDWRSDILKSASDTIDPEVVSLKERIDQVKNELGVEKVDLIAHSMGGLLVKKYLKDFGGGSINRFIDIGTPHVGAPSAYKILMYGDDLGVNKLFGLVGINSSRIKEISQNMPSVYELLPSESYFDSNDSHYSYYVFKDRRQSFEDTGNYLKAEGRNALLVDRAKAFHEEIDGLNPADYGVTTYNIVGCGTPTIGQFYILDNSIDHPIYNIKMIDGDGTVPLKSAQAIVATTTYYVRNVKHALMPSAVGVKELVAGILTSTSTNNLNISAYSNISEDQSGCGIPNGKIVSFHSPITLDVYDQFGNHAGPNANGDIENNISDISYETIGDNKFAFLPEGADYTIRGSAIGPGSFDVRIEEVVNGEVSTTTIFAQIPLISTTHTAFAIGSTTPTSIPIDTDNNGTFESSYNPSLLTAGIVEGTGHPVILNSQGPVESLSSRLPITSILPSLDMNKEEVKMNLRTEKEISTLLSAVPQGLKVPSSIVTSSITQVSSSAFKSFVNTAIVSKSFSQKLVNFFRKMWVVIKNKL
jgi:pimeloyl-ACP methyl ester carboxylesterase